MGIVIPVKDDSGRTTVFTAAAPAGWVYSFTSIQVKTSQMDSVIAKTPYGVALASVTSKFLKDDGGGGLIECTDQTDADANCIETRLYWERSTDIAIRGGRLFQITQPTAEIEFSCVAAPDVPEAYGGTVPFIDVFNLEFLPPTYALENDGKAVKVMKYDAVFHSNKFESILKHPAGHKHRACVCFEYFHPHP